MASPAPNCAINVHLDPPHFAGNANAQQDAREDAPCDEGETGEQCIQRDYVAHPSYLPFQCCSFRGGTDNRHTTACNVSKISRACSLVGSQRSISAHRARAISCNLVRRYCSSGVLMPRQMVRSTLAANDNDVVSLRSPPYRNSSNTAISAHTLPKPSSPIVASHAREGSRASRSMMN